MAAGTDLSVRKVFESWPKCRQGRLYRELEDLYRHTDEQVSLWPLRCDNCGRCCDFAVAGHRLFVSSLELWFFLLAVGPALKPPGEQDHCPYLSGEGCTARAYRPLGCRVYFCRPVRGYNSEKLTETFLHRVKQLAGKHGVPYFYCDWMGLLRQLGSENPLT